MREQLIKLASELDFAAGLIDILFGAHTAGKEGTTQKNPLPSAPRMPEPPRSAPATKPFAAPGAVPTHMPATATVRRRLPLTLFGLAAGAGLLAGGAGMGAKAVFARAARNKALRRNRMLGAGAGLAGLAGLGVAAAYKKRKD